MAHVSFAELIADAERGGYAVGYFESWNLESLSRAKWRRVPYFGSWGTMATVTFLFSGRFDTASFADFARHRADLALFPAIALSRDFGVEHDAFAALRRWMRRLRALDDFIVMPGIPEYH